MFPLLLFIVCYEDLEWLKALSFLMCLLEDGDQVLQNHLAFECVCVR